MAAGAQDFGAARMAGSDSGRMMHGMMPDSAMRRNGMGPGGMPGGMPPQGLGGMQGEVPEYKPECSAAQTLSIVVDKNYNADKSGVTIQEGVEYVDRDGIKLYLTIIMPKGSYTAARKVDEESGAGRKAAPCIVAVPGSAWRKQFIMAEHYVDYANRGFVVAVVEYRHTGQAIFPAQVQDCKTAVRFMRKSAAKYGVDVNNVFLLGDSSGGHTVLLTGTTSGNKELDTDSYSEYSDTVNAIAAFYPPTDIFAMKDYPSVVDHNSADSNEGALIGGEVSANQDKAWKASPVAYLSRDVQIPPILLADGTKDPIVPSNQTDRYACRLSELGKSFVFYSLPGASHGSAEFFTPEMVDLVTAFFEKYMK